MRKHLSILLVFFYTCTVFANHSFKHHFMLVGASFTIQKNGWFELSCKTFNAEPINKAVSGEAIYNTANRMATNTLYTTAELDRTDAFIIMHVHNRDVADTAFIKENYKDYSIPTYNYAVAYDYVIKKYKDDCFQLRNNPASRYYGTPKGKTAIIVLCTHWHDARTIYNQSIRLLVKKWNLPLVEWDKNIGFTKDKLRNNQQPSLQYAINTEEINGIKYAWHPLLGEKQYIQKKLSEIFNAKMKQVLTVK